MVECVKFYAFEHKSVEDEMAKSRAALSLTVELGQASNYGVSGGPRLIAHRTWR